MDSAQGASLKRPFIEHVQELRNRLIICLAVIGSMGIVGYILNDKLMAVIQKPLGQKLFYTSPTGGFSFVFKLCIFFGLICALPVIVFHIVKFLSPALKPFTRKTLAKYMVWSVILAVTGIIFAYLVSLPAALHFLANFGGQNIQSIITADEYFNFAIAYIAGFAVLFQLPLIIISINRIKPWKPKQLWRMQRYIILISFIVAAILTPTPDPFNQLLMALPIIALYQVATMLVWSINRKSLTSFSSEKMADIKRVNAKPVDSKAIQPGALKEIEQKPITKASAVNTTTHQEPWPISDFQIMPRAATPPKTIGTANDLKGKPRQYIDQIKPTLNTVHMRRIT